MSDLGQHLEDALAPEPAERFIVDDDSKASWAMLKLARAQAELADVSRQAVQYRALIDEWLESVKGPLEQAESFMHGLLVEYLRRLRAADDGPEDRKPKSHKLPTGTILSRAGSTTVEFPNQSAFVTWALKSHFLQLLAIRPAVAQIKAAIGATLSRKGEHLIYGGEIVPGVRIVDGERTYSVSPADLPPPPALLSHSPPTLGTPTEEEPEHG